MSDKREFKQTDTSANAKMDKDEPGLPVKIPLSILRWLAYSCLMAAATLSFLMPPMDITLRQWLGISAILGHFASQLNALIKK